jgi:GntR family transcriptional repressor for pyruvate dehydrogenase complex
MNNPSIRPPKLEDAIVERLQQMILEGTLQPGERLLSERELSAKLDVSRASLREALDKLIELGLLVTNAQGVAYVSEGGGQNLRDPLMTLLDTPEARFDCMELRSVVEAEAAAFAAERASPHDRDAIQACYAAMLVAHDNQNVDEIARTDAEFHFAIYEASHNLSMLLFMRSIESILRSNVYLNRKNLYEHRTPKDAQLHEHRAICEAIIARHPERARKAAALHMTNTMQTQRDIYEAERRLEASIRRLARNDLVAARKPRASAG